jgi:uncharacterized membrane protein YdjX (TVP38/TMEM64 family)
MSPAGEVEDSADTLRIRRRQRTAFRVIVLIALVVFIAGIGSTVTSEAVDAIRSAADGSEGPWSRALVYAVAAAFTFLTVFLPLPAEASAFLNGGIFPPGVAFVLTWVMAMAGAAASYEIGRWLGRPPAERMFGKVRLARVERLVEKAGWPTLLALRLSPVMAFTAINWASGILALSRPVYYWTTGVGLIPGTFVFTVVPGVLEDGGSAGLLIGLGFAAVFLLLGVSYLRMREPRGGMNSEQ